MDLFIAAPDYSGIKSVKLSMKVKKPSQMEHLIRLGQVRQMRGLSEVREIHLACQSAASLLSPSGVIAYSPGLTRLIVSSFTALLKFASQSEMPTGHPAVLKQV